MPEYLDSQHLGYSRPVYQLRAHQVPWLYIVHPQLAWQAMRCILFRAAGYGKNLGLAPGQHWLRPWDVSEIAHQAQAGEQVSDRLVAPRSMVDCLDEIHAIEALNRLLPELFVFANSRTQTLSSGRIDFFLATGGCHFRVGLIVHSRNLLE